MKIKKQKYITFALLLALSATAAPLSGAKAFHEAGKLAGRILLQVQREGEAWYVYPKDLQRYYLGRPADAFQIMRKLGLGISNSDFADMEGGGAPDRLLGMIILKVEDKGQAFYVSPLNGKFHYLGRPSGAFRIMRDQGLGISDEDISLIPIDYLSLPEFLEFSPNEFIKVYENADLLHLSDIAAPPPITYSQAADERIVMLAESEGYRLQSKPRHQLEPARGEVLQFYARNEFLALEKAAAREGINLGLVSGYRSIEEQRNIFLSGLRRSSEEKFGRQLENSEIAAGMADGIIRNILKTSSIPGYSKHHTGYAVDLIDITSGLEFTDFGKTRAYQWISKNNFFNAKRFGFIPSYPPGAENIEPEPEAWEYVWVGIGNLKK